MDSTYFTLHSICSSALYLASQCVSFCALAFFPFICLNGILLSLFLLKSLFFKPKFVENRLKTIAIDPSQSLNESHNGQIDLDDNNDQDEPGGNPNGSSSSVSNIRLMINSRIQQLYTNDLSDSLEYLSPSNDLIKLKEKIGSGFVGVLHKLHIERHEHYASNVTDQSAKCAKLIDLKSLRKIIEEVNGVGKISTGGGTLASLFKSSTKRSVLASMLLQHYQQFLEYACKLELSSSKTRSLSRQPHLLFYEQVLIYDDKCHSQRAHKKVFKGLGQADKHHLPTLLLLVMPHAKMNLRSSLLSEWGRFSLDTVSEWGRQIGKGLCYLHQELGMAHLNLKPENILLFEVGKDSSSPLHSRYTVKLSDCGSAFLLPTSSKVLSQSHETSIYTMSTPQVDKFSDKFEESVQYDIYCYAMTLLLMLVGYESFGKTFVLSQFPTGLVSTARYQLMGTIEAYDRARIPQTFVDLFRQIFSDNLSNTRLTVAQILKHAAFELSK